MGKRKISTFSISIPEEEAKREIERGSSLGKALKKAEDIYKERRKK